MASFITRDAVSQHKQLNKLTKQFNSDSMPLESLDVPGIIPHRADYNLCEYGVNIVQINLASTGSADSTCTCYSVSFEFLVTYTDSTTRWVKDVIITAEDPNGDEFREALLDYARAVRKRMQAVELKCD